MRRTAILAGVLLLLSLIALPVRAEEEFVGKPAPDFTTADINGADVNLGSLKGKVVWINFWGLRCGPCVRELPALQKIYENYGPKGLVILGVNADGVDGEFIKKSFAERDDLKALKVTFRLLTDLEFKLIDSYQLMGAPLNVMIDKNGVVQYYHEGYEDGDEKHYEEVVKSLLAK